MGKKTGNKERIHIHREKLWQTVGREKVKALHGASAPVEYFKGRVDQILKAKIAARFNKLLATALDFQFSRALRGDKLLGWFVK